jgi:hypothetical protein
MLKLFFLPFAVVFDVSLSLLERGPPRKAYKNGKGYTKPRMMDAVKDLPDDDHRL